MVVLQPHPQQWPGNDIKPTHLLMHKFISLPLVGQNNGILLAYELEDVSPRDHLFQLGMPGRCPPYPEVGDVVIVRNSSDRSSSMAVVRSVSTPTFTTDSQVEEKSKRKAITTRLLCGYSVLGHVGSLWAGVWNLQEVQGLWDYKHQVLAF